MSTSAPSHVITALPIITDLGSPEAAAQQHASVLPTLIRAASVCPAVQVRQIEGNVWACLAKCVSDGGVRKGGLSALQKCWAGGPLLRYIVLCLLHCCLHEYSSNVWKAGWQAA